MRSTRPGFTALIATALIGMSAAASAQTTPYSVIDIGRLPGTSRSYATDVNDQRQVVGLSDERAFIWEPGAGIRELPAPGAVSDLRIDEAGLIAGGCQASGRQRICVWRDGGLEILTPPFSTPFTIRALTDNGILLLESHEGGLNTRSWALVVGAAYDLTAIFGGRIYSVNSHGLVGGLTADGRGFVNNLAGELRYPFPPHVVVQAVGESGYLAGAPTSGAVLYLAHPDGAVDAIACQCYFPAGGINDINRDGDFVATFKGISTSTTAVVVRQRRAYQMHTLAPEGAVSSLFTGLSAINDSGDIAGSTAEPGGITARATLFMPNLPPAPMGVVASPGARTAGLRWDAVDGAVAYRVEAGSSPGATDLYDGDVGDVTSVTSGVAPGTYYVRVRAVSPAGLGPASAEVTFTVE